MSGKNRLSFDFTEERYFKCPAMSESSTIMLFSEENYSDFGMSCEQAFLISVPSLVNSVV